MTASELLEIASKIYTEANELSRDFGSTDQDPSIPSDPWTASELNRSAEGCGSLQEVLEHRINVSEAIGAACTACGDFKEKISEADDVNKGLVATAYVALCSLYEGIFGHGVTPPKVEYRNEVEGVSEETRLKVMRLAYDYYKCPNTDKFIEVKRYRASDDDELVSPSPVACLCGRAADPMHHRLADGREVAVSYGNNPQDFLDQDDDHLITARGGNVEAVEHPIAPEAEARVVQLSNGAKATLELATSTISCPGRECVELRRQVEVLLREAVTVNI